MKSGKPLGKKRKPIFKNFQPKRGDADELLCNNPKDSENANATGCSTGLFNSKPEPPERVEPDRRQQWWDLEKDELWLNSQHY